MPQSVLDPVRLRRNRFVGVSTCRFAAGDTRSGSLGRCFECASLLPGRPTRRAVGVAQVRRQLVGAGSIGTDNLQRRDVGRHTFERRSLEIGRVRSRSVASRPRGSSCRSHCRPKVLAALREQRELAAIGAASSLSSSRSQLQGGALLSRKSPAPAEDRSVQDVQSSTRIRTSERMAADSRSQQQENRVA